MGSRISVGPTEPTGISSTHSHSEPYSGSQNASGRRYTQQNTVSPIQSGVRIHRNVDRTRRTNQSSYVMSRLITELEHTGLSTDDSRYFRQLFDSRNVTSNQPNDSNLRTSRSSDIPLIAEELLREPPASNQTSQSVQHAHSSRGYNRRHRSHAGTAINSSADEADNSAHHFNSRRDEILSFLTAAAARSRNLSDSVILLDGSDQRCTYCGRIVPHDEFPLHYVLCATRPRIKYNQDRLTVDMGECAICLDDMKKDETIARLPCLCIYHKKCIDDWFKRKQCCPEHPED